MPPASETFKITDWDEIQLDSLKFTKSKLKIRHPYAQKLKGYDLSKLIEVEVEGEFRNGVPHSNCLMYFTYAGELESDYVAPSIVDPSPYLDGQALTFRGTGVFMDGVLSGSALFIQGNGWVRSFSMIKDGRPSDGCLQRAYFPEGKKIPINSKTDETDVSGCIGSVGLIDSDRF